MPRDQRIFSDCSPKPVGMERESVANSSSNMLMNLHKKSHSTEAASATKNGLTSNSFRRPRSYTADETFQAAKNWLLKRKQRTLGHKGSFPELEKNISGLEDRSGSLSALWSPRWKHETISVIVIGEQKTGKSTLISRLVDLWCENHENESPFEKNRRFSFDQDVERIWVQDLLSNGVVCWTKLRFVEVDYTKDDLWRTLSGSGFIVTYSMSDISSLKSVSTVLTWLRMPAHNPLTPIWLIGTDFAQNSRNRGNLDAKTLAHQFNCDLLEISSREHSSENCFKTAGSTDGRRLKKLLDSILNSVVLKSNLHCKQKRRSLEKDHFSPAGLTNSQEQLYVVHETLRKSSSHSCENLHMDQDESSKPKK